MFKRVLGCVALCLMMTGVAGAYNVVVRPVMPVQRVHPMLNRNWWYSYVLRRESMDFWNAEVILESQKVYMKEESKDDSSDEDCRQWGYFRYSCDQRVMDDNFMK